MPTFEQFRMPDAGEGLTEAEVVQWHVAVGDTVTVNQVILEVETAKSLVDLPSPFTGVVTEIHGDQGDVVEVGTVIMVVDTDPDGQPAASDSSPESVGAPVPATASPERADVAGAGADAPETAGEADSDSGSVLVGYGTVHGATTRRARRACCAGIAHSGGCPKS